MEDALIGPSPGSAATKMAADAVGVAAMNNGDGISCASNVGDRTQRLHRRLSDLGASETRFVHHEEPRREGVVEAKTLIWEAVRVRRRRDAESTTVSVGTEEKKGEQSDGEGGHEWEEFVDHVFAVVLREDDRVDGLRLRELVRRRMVANKTALKNGDTDPIAHGSQERLVIRLAPLNVAEGMTGYVSGTIPPVGHLTPLSALYLDDGMLVPLGDNVSSGSGVPSSPNGDIRAIERSAELPPTVSVGSGCRLHSAHIPWHELIAMGEKETSSPVIVQPISRSAFASRAPSVSSRHRSLSNPLPRGSQTMSSMRAYEKEVKRKERKAEGSSQVATVVSMWPKKRNVTEFAQLLRTTAKKQGRSSDVRLLIEEAGDSFRQLMDCGPEGPSGKNALHMAAWKGDLETIALLIDAGKSSGLDLVNTISTGSGNYGKTPISYSITQCRDEVVLYLLSRGADLLIVNNKGQTACSLAASHLKPETCRYMSSIEASQLKRTGKFLDYRRSHSDGQRYGDLDPRFNIDDANMDDDLVLELERYRNLVRNATIATAGEGTGFMNLWEMDQDKRVSSLTEIEGLPKSVRQTVRHWQKGNDNTSVINNVHGLNTSAALIVSRDSHNSSDSRPKKSRTQSIVSLGNQDKIDFDSLKTLTIEHLVPNGSGQVPRICRDANDISRLAEVVQKSITKVGCGAPSGDQNAVESLWGLDCEWKPSKNGRGSDNPVATLQLAHSSGQSFLIDLQTLCQRGVLSPDEPLTQVEAALSAALSNLFLHRGISILGFGIGQDLNKLSASFPHIPCFRLLHNVTDLHSLLSQVYDKQTLDIRFPQIGSLQKAVAVLMGRKLDKSEQCSDWECRPLTQAQINYAVLDAAVLPSLILTLRKRYARASSFHLDSSSHRFTYLGPRVNHNCKPDESDPGPEQEYEVPMGRVKNVLSVKLARQSWPTGRPTPNPPILRRPQKPNKAPLRNDGGPSDEEGLDPSPSRGRTRRRETLLLAEVPGFFEGLPRPGIIMGYTKDSCVHRVIGKNTVPENMRLGFNRRGGTLRMSNGWLLFANFGGQASYGRYRNAFTHGGQKMTFSLNRGREKEDALLDYLSSMPRHSERHLNVEYPVSPAQDKNEHAAGEQKVLLFMRPSLKQKFMFCGECSCAELNSVNESEDGAVELLLSLKDFDQLIDREDFLHYLDIVLSQQ